MKINDVEKLIKILKNQYDNSYDILFNGDVEGNLIVDIYKNKKLITQYPIYFLEDLIKN